MKDIWDLFQIAMRVFIPLESFQVVLLLFIYVKSPLHCCTISGNIFFGMLSNSQKSNTNCKFQWYQQQIHLEVTRFFFLHNWDIPTWGHEDCHVCKHYGHFAGSWTVEQKITISHSCHSWTSLEVRIEVTLTAMNRHNLCFRYLKPEVWRIWASCIPS